MNLTLMGDRILVKLPIIEQMKNGIIMPDSAMLSSNIGTVVAVGQGHKRHSDEDFIVPPFQVGDEVMFGGNNAGAPVEFEDELYALFNTYDVVAIIHKKEA